MEENQREITILPNLEELSHCAARKFVEIAAAEIETKGYVTVALAGGSTPKRMYQMLANEREPFRRQIKWQLVRFFWSDERCVAPDSPDSNFLTAFENLLQPLGLSPMDYFRFRGEGEPFSAAADYERFLRVFFNAPGTSLPRFDLILLGMGADGHTASLFPGSETIEEKEKLAAAPFVEKFAEHRLTLSPPVLNSAANVIFQVAGEDKTEALREVLEGEFNPRQFPAQIVKPWSGKTFWFADEAAANDLTIRRKYENFTGRLRR